MVRYSLNSISQYVRKSAISICSLEMTARLFSITENIICLWRLPLWCAQNHEKSYFFWLIISHFNLSMLPIKFSFCFVYLSFAPSPPELLLSNQPICDESQENKISVATPINWSQLNLSLFINSCNTSSATTTIFFTLRVTLPTI